MVVSALLLTGALSEHSQAQSFEPVIELGSLSEADGFRLDGVAENDRSGNSVSMVGDVNGDGIDDLIIAAYTADPGNNSNAGSSYVVFGTNGERGDLTNGALALSSLDGTSGFRIDGAEADDSSGFSVSAAGDINGDGIDDLIIGAYRAGPNGFNLAGSSFVVFGTDGPRGDLVAGAFSLSTLDGTNGFRLDGAAAEDRSGNSVSSAGDINGDGIDDLIIGAYRADPGAIDQAGSSYVVFGRNSMTGSFFNATMNLGSLNGSDGFRLDGVEENDRAGSSVSSAGDVNGDGIDDLIISARIADPGGISNAGSSYVVFGRDTTAGASFEAAINLGVIDGSNGFRLDGVAESDRSGSSVSGVGDVNGDGIDDLLIGAPDADPVSSSYVVFGAQGVRDDLIEGALALASLNGTNGFRLDGGASVRSAGYSVSAGGDINSDGIDDMIIGAPDSNDDSGNTFVVFGRDGERGDLTAGALALSTLDGNNGFQINGAAVDDFSGWSVSGAGDINGDGIDDLIIGAYGASPTALYSGASFVVFGRPPSIIFSDSFEAP